MNRSPFLSVEEARDRICADVAQLPGERVDLASASGRTLAEAVVAPRAQPPFDASAMDGYALATSGEGATAGREFNLRGEAAAGHPFTASLSTGDAVRIFTGAPLPAGADTILIQEDAEPCADERIAATALATPGRWIRALGCDFAAGDRLIEAGKVLGASDLMLVAAAGFAEVTVTRRPRIAILATGDELVPPGSTPAPGQIFSSVPAGLAALVTHFGGVPDTLGIAGDSFAELDAKLARAGDANVVLTIGGASVGDHDLVHSGLQRAGAALDFWKIAMRPGKPLMFARRDRQVFLGLPGNPVSGIVCARIFLVPLIARLLGRAPATSDVVRLPLAAPRPANGPREHYMRATIEMTDTGERRVRVAADQDSSLMTVLARADALVRTPPGACETEAGTLVDVLPLDF